jgi:hypothetical protein
LKNVLGKWVWETYVALNIGEQPYYRVGGRELTWREACQLQQQPSPFWTEERMIEIDFVVPKEIDGKPTTVRRVLEVFAHATKPVGCRYIDPKVLNKYGDIPVEESYIARITFSVEKGTRGRTPAKRIRKIAERGKGLYRPHKLIELMIAVFLAHQVGKKMDYGPSWTYSQCEETIEEGEEVHYVMAGGFEEPTSDKPGGLHVGFKDSGRRYLGYAAGAGALQKF